MYRYTVDNAITYTSEDVVLFRESPFACWMERLTLENPAHGIPPDVGSSPPANSMLRQDDIAATLRTEGRDVALVDWDLEERLRRSATLEAMRNGVDFIVNGQLALGPLSGSANLLMRTSGYSELGAYLYVPCDTQGKTSLHSAFRLCFLADLLHSLQGQLPPQMLIIRGDNDVVPLQTEDHIYHYRAVKQRFMNAMRDFRKHRMPDPAESSLFGRWSDCALEVLKQRALSGESEDSAEAEGEALSGWAQVTEAPLVNSGAALLASIDGDSRGVDEIKVCSDAGSTLAEQAGMLQPNAYRVVKNAPVPGHTPNLARVMAVSRSPAAGRREDDGEEKESPLPEEKPPAEEREGAVGALENLQFIGSAPRPSTDTQAAPVELPATQRDRLHPLDSPGFPQAEAEASVVDLDSTPPVGTAAVKETAAKKPPRFSWEALERDAQGGGSRGTPERHDAVVADRPFSSSLITNDHYQD